LGRFFPKFHATAQKGLDWRETEFGSEEKFHATTQRPRRWQVCHLSGVISGNGFLSVMSPLIQPLERLLRKTFFF